MFLPFFTFLIISFDAQVFNLDEVQELKDYSFPIKWSGTLIENHWPEILGFLSGYSFHWSVCLSLCPNLTI